MPLPFEGLRADEMMVVGEDSTITISMLVKRRVDAGRVVTFGLDLLSGLPEAPVRWTA